MAGVSLSVVKSVERGNPRVSIENAEKVLALFGMELVAKNKEIP
jgi:predicted transcriptional regulator